MTASKPAKAKKVLRPYQLCCNVALTAAYVQGQKRALVVMATGLGKTFTIAEFVRNWLQYHGGRVLFMVDQTGPMRQARKGDFASTLAGTGFTTGIICSKETENPDADVLFTTFQGMGNRLSRYTKDEFTLIIVDECHHAPAETYLGVLEYFSGATFTVGLTATPERADTTTWDTDEVFGRPVFQLTLMQALRMAETQPPGYLAYLDYRLMSDNLDEAKLRELLRRLDEGDRLVSIADINRSVFLEESLEEQCRIIRKEQGASKKTIIFCRDVKHIEVVNEFMPDAVPFHSKAEGGLDAILHDFREGDLQTILVINMFNEGMDIPDAELVVFLRVTDSVRIWTQQLGRGLRNAEKTVIVLDFVGNVRRLQMIAGFLEDYGATPDFDPKSYSEDGVSVEDWGGHLKPKPGLDDGDSEAEADSDEDEEEDGDSEAEADSDEDEEEDEPGGGGGGNRKSVIIAAGFKILFSEEMVDILAAADKVVVELYSTMGEAMTALRRLRPRVLNSTQYQQHYRKDRRLPQNPKKFYSDEWRGWPHFCGTGKVWGGQEFYDYRAASALARAEGVTSKSLYQELASRTASLPSNPNRTYSEDWVDWGMFLGKERRREEAGRRSHLLPYADAVKFVRDNGVTTEPSYRELRRGLPKPKCLPRHPDVVYEDDWVDWSTFLGTHKSKLRGRSARFWDYEIASAFVQSKKVGSKSEYEELASNVKQLPSTPRRTYKDDWLNWDTFLGKSQRD